MKRIWVTTQFKGFHIWGEAPEEVEFLRNNHRHLFKVKITIEVLHDNRELEFFILQEILDTFIDVELTKDNLGSCEMIGEQIKLYFEKEYPNRFIEVEVSEDGENGAIV